MGDGNVRTGAPEEGYASIRIHTCLIRADAAATNVLTRSSTGLVLVQFVVERLERDAQFLGCRAFVAVVLVEHVVDHLHFHFAQSFWASAE